MPLNSYYSNTIYGFLKEDPNQLDLILKGAGSNQPEQVRAWDEEIEILQSALLPFEDEEGRVIFEDTIPRMDKRIDVTVL